MKSDKKLDRMNQLAEETEIDSNEYLKNLEEIKKLQERNKEIEILNERRKKNRLDIARDKYSEKKVRKRLVKFGEQSELPELSSKAKPYIDIDVKSVPEDYLDLFIQLDNIKSSSLKNGNPLIDTISTLSDKMTDFFILKQDGEEEENNDY